MWQSTRGGLLLRRYDRAEAQNGLDTYSRQLAAADVLSLFHFCLHLIPSQVYTSAAHPPLIQCFAHAAGYKSTCSAPRAEGPKLSRDPAPLPFSALSTPQSPPAHGGLLRQT